MFKFKTALLELLRVNANAGEKKIVRHFAQNQPSHKSTKQKDRRSPQLSDQHV